jgi:homoserine dehydrogenase
MARADLRSLSSSARPVRIGVLGCGSVGRGFVQLASAHRERILARSGVELDVSHVLVRDLTKDRPGVDRRLLTDDADEVIQSGCDIVVELIGGIEPAGELIRSSFEYGADVVTANKALLAAAGRTLFREAAASGRRIGFEASVCGGIPIVGAITRGLAGDSLESIQGILNGTCNYVLTRMEEEWMEFDDAVRLAQDNGFAEADPALDIDGHDAAQKLAILVELGFDLESDSERTIALTGLREVGISDIAQARARGRVIRHVATARHTADGAELRVAPIELPRTHRLAGVRDENNGVVLRGDAVGDLFFSGKGAGSMPTAAAVLADVIEIAQSRRGALEGRRPAASRTASSPGGLVLGRA